MARPRGLVALPTEINGYVLDYLTLLDIFRLSWTTRSFRRIAIGHRTYWHSVSLSESSSAATEIFRTRLTAAGDRPFVVMVQLAESTATVRQVILPLVRQHLFHIKELTLEIRAAHYRSLFLSLQGSALLLRSLKLQLLVSPSAPLHIELPVNILSSKPGVLRTLLLHNISLPQPACPAFRYVEDFNHTWGAGLLVLPFPRIFMHFPNVRVVSLGGCSYPMLREESSLWASQKIATLDTLVIFWEPSLLFLAQARVYGIRFVSVDAFSTEVVQELFGHLDGALRVEIRQWFLYRIFELRIHSVHTGFVRNFIEHFDKHDPAHYCYQPNVLLSSAAMWDRVTSLVIPSSLSFNIHDHIIELCCVETIEIVCDGEELEPWVSDATLRCPRLKDIQLNMRTLLGTLSTLNVRCYLMSVLGTFKKPVEALHIPHGDLVGPISLLQGICSRVRLSSGTTVLQ